MRANLLLAALLLPGPTVRGAPAEDLAGKAQRGKEAMAAGRFDEAAVLYGEITRALPDEPGMLLNLGLALAMAGRPREALRPLEAALKRQPDLLPASLFLGVARMDLGQPAQAVEPLQKVVAAQPENDEARRRLADALWMLDRFAEAAENYRELARRAPQDPRAWYGLGRSYEGLARLAFERLGRVAPESDYMLRLVGQTMLSDGKHANAYRLYREALEKRPGLAEAHEAIATIYERTGHADWAASEREKARAAPAPPCASPSMECDFRAGRYDAVLAEGQGRQGAEGQFWQARAARERAAEAFGRLERLPPSPESVLRHVEVLRAQRRRLGEAVAQLKKAVAAWPDDTRLRRELATVLFLANNAEEARPLLEQLLAREPESPELALLLGEAWLRTLEPSRAIPVLEKAVTLDPQALAAQAALGRAYLEAGEPARAVAPLLRALPTDKDGSLHYQIARAYRATGQPDRAAAAMARFEELRKSADAEAESLREEFKITPP
jgi:predicted Zn-dependent protease